MPVPGSPQGWQCGGSGLCGEGGCSRPPQTCSPSAPMQVPSCHQPPDRHRSPPSSSFPRAASSRPGRRGAGTGLQAPEPTPHLHTLQKRQGRIFAPAPSPCSGAAQVPAHTAPPSQPRLLPWSIPAPSQINTSLWEPKGLGVPYKHPQPLTSGQVTWQQGLVAAEQDPGEAATQCCCQQLLYPRRATGIGD